MTVNLELQDNMKDMEATTDNRMLFIAHAAAYRGTLVEITDITEVGAFLDGGQTLDDFTWHFIKWGRVRLKGQMEADEKFHVDEIRIEDKRGNLIKGWTPIDPDSSLALVIPPIRVNKQRAHEWYSRQCAECRMSFDSRDASRANPHLCPACEKEYEMRYAEYTTRIG